MMIETIFPTRTAGLSVVYTPPGYRIRVDGIGHYLFSARWVFVSLETAIEVAELEVLKCIKWDEINDGWVLVQSPEYSVYKVIRDLIFNGYQSRMSHF